MRRFKPPHRESGCDMKPMTAQKLNALLDEEKSSILLVDIRPYTMYSFTHIESAISICIPSTLLKRQTFGFSRILEFVAPQDVDVLKNVTNTEHIVFYDQYTHNCTNDSSLQRTGNKFLSSHPELKGRLYWVVGGLANVAREAPQLVEAGDDLMAAAQNGSDFSPSTKCNGTDAENLDNSTDEAPKLTLSSVKAAPKSPFSLLPVFTGLDPTLGSPLHTPSRTKPPLDESTRILVEDEVASRLVEFPNWLFNAVKRTEGGQNVLAEVFQRLQAAELRRISGGPSSSREASSNSSRLLSPHIRSVSPRTPSTPFSDSMNPVSVSSAGSSPVHGRKEYSHHQRNHVYQQQQQLQQQKQELQSQLQHEQQQRYGQRSTPDSRLSSPLQSYVIVAGDDPRKNRYTNIAPFGHNRVIVRGSEYLNASYINSSITDLQYIATQAPVPASFGDFWWCCWEQHVPLIVMLTTLRTESGQIKGHNYWIDSEYDGLKVRLLHESQEGIGDHPTGVTIRKIQLSLNGEARIINHLQYENWPDLGCPADPNEVLRVIEIKRHLLGPLNRSSYVVVHCSAGCGRTGTFCAIDSVTDYLDHLDRGEAQRDENDRVHEVVSEFRKQRIAMVQNQRQLLLCYQAVMLWYLRRLETEN